MSKNKNKPLHKVFVYGTLRDGVPATHKLYGYRMFLVPGAKGRDFPFVQETEGNCSDGVYTTPYWHVQGNIIKPTAAELAKLDKYEGLDKGLYTREKLRVEEIATRKHEEVWVYVGGPSLVYQPINSGDWLSR